MHQGQVEDQVRLLRIADEEADSLRGDLASAREDLKKLSTENAHFASELTRANDELV